MEHVEKCISRHGANLKHGRDLHPADREGCVGNRGIDKTYTLERVVAIAFKMPRKPNILIKAGVNAKWYIKECHPDRIEFEIEKARVAPRGGKSVHLCTMYIITWKEPDNASEEGIHLYSK
jgi:hypothetical protein